MKKVAYNYFKDLYEAPMNEDLLNLFKVIKNLPRFFSDLESEDILEGSYHIRVKGSG